MRLERFLVVYEVGHAMLPSAQQIDNLLQYSSQIKPMEIGKGQVWTVCRVFENFPI